MECSILQSWVQVRQANRREGNIQSNPSHRRFKQYVASFRVTPISNKASFMFIVGNNTTDTRHTVRSQLNMKKPSAQKQEDPAKTYDFVICDPQNDHYDSAYQDVMTLGTDNVVIYHQPYPSNSCGIPGRPARLVPGSSRPWRVNEQS